MNVSPLLQCGTSDCNTTVSLHLKDKEFYECPRCQKYFCEFCFTLQNCCVNCHSLKSLCEPQRYTFCIRQPTTDNSRTGVTSEQTSVGVILEKYFSTRELLSFDFISIQLEGSPLVTSIKPNAPKIKYPLLNLLHQTQGSFNNLVNIYLLHGNSWCSCKEKTEFVDDNCPLCGLSLLTLTHSPTFFSSLKPLKPLKPLKFSIRTSNSFGCLQWEGFIEDKDETQALQTPQTLYEIFQRFYVELKSHNMLSNVLFYHEFSISSKKFCLCSPTPTPSQPLNNVGKTLSIMLLPYFHRQKKTQCPNSQEGLFSLQFVNSMNSQSQHFKKNDIQLDQ